MTSSFDRIAPIYDWLACFIFGRSVAASQMCFLDSLKECRCILILGGGTGGFLPALFKKNPEAECIFIDASAEMLRRARTRVNTEKIVFICGTELSIPSGYSFDAVLTFYYLDLFDDLKLKDVIAGISHLVATNVVWLATDFVDEGKLWQRPLLKLMYFFFWVTCGLETKKLPAWITLLENGGFVPTRSERFRGGFIKSLVLKRSLLHS